MRNEEELTRIINVDKTLEIVASPGAYLVDSLPFLTYLPTVYAPFKQEAQCLRNEELSLFRKFQQSLRADMQMGERGTSFTLSFLDKQERYQLTDDEGAYVVQQEAHRRQRHTITPVRLYTRIQSAAKSTSIMLSYREQSREPTECPTRSNWPGRAGKPRPIQLMERGFLEGPALCLVPVLLITQ